MKTDVDTDVDSMDLSTIVVNDKLRSKEKVGRKEIF